MDNDVEIVELDLSKLKSKKGNKLIKLVKKVVIGVVALVVSFESLVYGEMALAKEKSRNDSIIQEIIDSDESKEDKIAELFTYGIKSNPYLSEEYKEIIIESFCSDVIYPYGYLFTDKLIDNIYAVASTEKVGDSEKWFFVKNKGGESDYPLNAFFVGDGVEGNYDTFAHEQLHGIRNYGLTNCLPSVIEEAGTSIFSTGGYPEETNIFNFIGMIIGYDKLVEIYFNNDTKALKQEFCKYMSESDASELISALNINIDHYNEFHPNGNIQEVAENISKYLIKLYVDKNNNEEEAEKLVRGLLDDLYEYKKNSVSYTIEHSYAEEYTYIVIGNSKAHIYLEIDPVTFDGSFDYDKYNALLEQLSLLYDFNPEIYLDLDLSGFMFITLYSQILKNKCKFTITELNKSIIEEMKNKTIISGYQLFTKYYIEGQFIRGTEFNYLNDFDGYSSWLSDYILTVEDEELKGKLIEIQEKIQREIEEKNNDNNKTL